MLRMHLHDLPPKSLVKAEVAALDRIGASVNAGRDGKVVTW